MRVFGLAVMALVLLVPVSEADHGLTKRSKVNGIKVFQRLHTFARASHAGRH